MKLIKAWLLLPLALLLLCGCTVQDYPVYTYEINNGLGEAYLVNYCEQTDYPDNNTRIKVFKGKDKVGDYEGGAYTGCDSYIPSQIMFLCRSGDVDFYYIRTQQGEYIAADGMIDLKMKFNMMCISSDVSQLKQSDKQAYAKLAAMIRGAVSAQDAQKRFSDCGYSSDSFTAFYNYQ